MSDRIFSVALLAITAIYAVMAISIEVPFQYEPLGPQAWPILLAIVVGICGVIVLVRPDAEPEWPPRTVLRRAVILLVGLVLYAVLLEPLGFMITTTLVCGTFALMLGAPKIPAVVFALVMGVPG
ncbi:tripartite tricarboxylate transporter TctB family protein (plasmid) [Skermanella sp. TT6]|uniref:Tripartite tricarboxylate transporter TctB family protein n=1 Tax=Skermanella cutis TaxID=2775420 RepID=A0ABX7BE96_9PROT|nr:tripartite tricarboxylate transporter TctB family protein [Skermanella sp. TT6]QQP92706.1 tripartite tricarboxylate transporter TctB family protein [Skermanella sp. TT6]